MRPILLLTCFLVVVLVTTSIEGKKKKGCKLNNKVIKAGKIAYKDKAHCLKLRCVKKKSKRGKAKYMLMPKSYRNCQCFPILCRGKRCSPPEPCPKCSNVFEPVCGTNNATYTNECQLWGKTIPCGLDEAKLLFYGECGKCPIGCPKNMDPVCGSDGYTYNNECLMITAACETTTTITVVHKGSCADGSDPAGGPDIGKCGKCPKDRRPVCGSDGKTYSNKCLLEAAVCLGEDVTLVHDGPCEGDPETIQPGVLRAKRNTCKYNGKKYNSGDMITDMVDYCLTVACQPSSKIGKSMVVFQDFQAANACECSNIPLKKKLLRLTRL